MRPTKRANDCPLVSDPHSTLFTNTKLPQRLSTHYQGIIYHSFEQLHLALQRATQSAVCAPADPLQQRSFSALGAMSSTKVEHKAVYDLAKKELKNRTEIKLDSGIKVCLQPSQAKPNQARSCCR